MTDRELLELAAKAAGLYVQGDESHLGFFSGLNIREDDCPGGYRWNPLTDDGDALRLAVHLGLSVEVHHDIAQPLPWLRVVDRNGNWTHCGPQDYHGDELMQTRRAIVRAAVAIGRASDGV